MRKSTLIKALAFLLSFAMLMTGLPAPSIAESVDTATDTVVEQTEDTLIDMLNAMETREDVEDFQNPVDIMFERLERKKPQHFAVRQYKKYKLAAGVVCSKRLLNQMIWKSLRTHNFTYRRKETKP